MDSFNDMSVSEKKRILIELLEEVKLKEEEVDIHTFWKDKNHDLLQTLSDNSERCRENGALLILQVVSKSHLTLEVDWAQNLLEVLNKRLTLTKRGVDNENFGYTESSEEVRLVLAKIFTTLICKASQDFKSKFWSGNIDRIVDTICFTLQDGYTDVFVEGAKSTVYLQRCPQLHYCSAKILKILFKTISNRKKIIREHSVRCMESILYSNRDASLFENCCSHLAQRLFDSSDTVRVLVVKLSTNLMLHHHCNNSGEEEGGGGIIGVSNMALLIALTLTNYSHDESEAVLNTISEMWANVGHTWVELQSLHDDRIKEERDFLEDSSLSMVKRPPLGCRLLASKHIYKLLPPIERDMSNDWREDTSEKAMQLLHALIVHGEDTVCVGQCHVLLKLCRLSLTYKNGNTKHKKSTKIVDWGVKCLQLLANFVPVDVWFPLLVNSHLKTSSSKSVTSLITVSDNVIGLKMMAVLISKSSLKKLSNKSSFDDEKECDDSFVSKILNVLIDKDVIETDNIECWTQISNCCFQLMDVLKNLRNIENERESIEFDLFTVIVSLFGSTDHDELKRATYKLVEKLMNFCEIETAQQIFEKHSTKFLIERVGLYDQSAFDETNERRVKLYMGLFEMSTTFAIETNPLCLKQIFELCKSVLLFDNSEISKLSYESTETKMKSMIFVAQIFQSLQSNSSNGINFEEILREVILPHLPWRVGRKAQALRTSAVSALLMFLNSECWDPVNFNLLKSDLIPVMNALSEDASLRIRTLALRCFESLFKLMMNRSDLGASVEILSNSLRLIASRIADEKEEVREICLDVLLSLSENKCILKSCGLDDIPNILSPYTCDKSETIRFKVEQVLFMLK